MENYWSEFEYNKLKLLLHNKKVNSILKVLNKEKEYDDLYPLSIELHLTDRCNLKCPWCTDQKLRENFAANKKENIFKLFDVLSEHNVGITIEGGGEPTLHKDFKEIVEYGKLKKLDMGLITNSVIDISQYASYFKWIRVSVDSSTRDEYIVEKGADKFDQVMENIQRISLARDVKETHLGVGYVFTNRNHSNIEMFIKKLNDMQVDYVYFRPVEEHQDLMPNLHELYSFKENVSKLTENMRIKILMNINERLVKNNEKLPCIAHSLTCIIHSDGDVALCEKRRHDPIIFGNINKNTFDEIWKSNFRKEISQKLLDPKCQMGCEVCRITGFNKALFDVNKLYTKNFI